MILCARNVIRNYVVSRSKFTTKAHTLRATFGKTGGLVRHSLQSSYHHIAIVGTGPSGFYTAKYCLDINNDVRVDMFERLPTPYGLVRYGVAPDHPEVKTAEETFISVAKSPRVRFYGNVEVGDIDESDVNVNEKNPIRRHVSLQTLREKYSAVVLAYGAVSDNALGIPGEELPGVVSSRTFVNWYNGHPEFADLHQSTELFRDLRTVKHVVIIGQGNVALDCARILTKEIDTLQTTDMSSSALEHLRDSGVKKVTLLGRRGHVQSAFTIKEFRELTKLNNVEVSLNEEDLQKGMTPSSMKEIESKRPLKRLTELIEKTAGGTPPTRVDRVIQFEYLTTPIEILGETGTSSGEGSHPVVTGSSSSTSTGDGASDSSDSSSDSVSSSSDSSSRRTSITPAAGVTGVRVVRNTLTGKPFEQRAVPVEVQLNPEINGGEEIIPCDMVIKSVGYKCKPISRSLPFDHHRNKVPHVKGRVLWEEAEGVDVHATPTGVAEDISAVADSKDSPSKISRNNKSLGIGEGEGETTAHTGTATTKLTADDKRLGQLYVTGWLKRGATGIIATNVPDAKETASSIAEDIADGYLVEKAVSSSVAEAEDKYAWNEVGSTNNMPPVVTWQTYELIDAEEKRRGQLLCPPKIRDKMTSISDMLSTASQSGSKER